MGNCRKFKLVSTGSISHRGFTVGRVYSTNANGEIIDDDGDLRNPPYSYPLSGHVFVPCDFMYYYEQIPDYSSCPKP